MTGCDCARGGNCGTVTNGTDPSTKAIAQVVWRTRTLWCDAASHELAANDNACLGLRLQDLADAYLYLGDIERPSLRVTRSQRVVSRIRMVMLQEVT